ncbi:protein FAR1-RELATED SEQUENCE 9-like isoform X2 [Panicum miliaceum]|uniref:Protein FAR1-RELATED SEQUENCE 9-like isoform X2 n=1 Tax=Panicum miliaceum TaxID=4540 RepID=A0A3L6Q606_PANMI|nr:protein FAR1-RELATED SEQUENCE 9-like isoform X2 [Panicum miliaceum]
MDNDTGARKRSRDDAGAGDMQSRSRLMEPPPPPPPRDVPTSQTLSATATSRARGTRNITPAASQGASLASSATPASSPDPSSERRVPSDAATSASATEPKGETEEKMDLHAVEISKKMERGAESSPLLPAQTMAERNLKSYQETSGANGDSGMHQGNESANREPYGLVASAMNKVDEARKEAEEGSDMAMVEMENTSRGDADLEERYGIMLAPEHEVREHGNLTTQESLPSPIFLWNDTEMNRRSEIQVLGAGETFVQELGQENGNVVLNEGDEDLNECQKDQAEADADGTTRSSFAVAILRAPDYDFLGSVATSHFDAAVRDSVAGPCAGQLTVEGVEALIWAAVMTEAKATTPAVGRSILEQRRIRPDVGEAVAGEAPSLLVATRMQVQLDKVVDTSTEVSVGGLGARPEPGASPTIVSEAECADGTNATPQKQSAALLGNDELVSPCSVHSEGQFLSSQLEPSDKVILSDVPSLSKGFGNMVVPRMTKTMIILKIDLSSAEEGRWTHKCIMDASGTRREVKMRIPKASSLAREGREA